MLKKDDLTDKTLAGWKVIGGRKVLGVGKNRYSLWLCECLGCGTKEYIKTIRLKSNKKKYWLRVYKIICRN